MIELSDVQAAAARIEPHIHRTPVLSSRTLNAALGREVLFKGEHLQKAGSFKVRGALNAALQLPPGTPGLVALSSGNHAQGVAFACRHFGSRGTIFMPVTTPQQKIDKTRAFGGDFVEIELVGDIFDVCNQAALDYADANDAIMVPPFDHPDIIEGQATVALEIVEQLPAGATLDRLHVAVGGGGLASGIALAIPETAIVTVEPEGTSRRPRRRRASDATARPPTAACSRSMASAWTTRTTPSG